MAFDMYADKRKEKIDHHEEPLFGLVGEDYEDYPKLNDVWGEFYDSPHISPNMANEIVHELIKLNDLIGSTEDANWIQPIFLRLSSFFSFAYTNNIDIKCVSD